MINPTPPMSMCERPDTPTPFMIPAYKTRPQKSRGCPVHPCPSSLTHPNIIQCFSKNSGGKMVEVGSFFSLLGGVFGLSRGKVDSLGFGGVKFLPVGCGYGS